MYFPRATVYFRGLNTASVAIRWIACPPLLMKVTVLGRRRNCISLSSQSRVNRSAHIPLFSRVTTVFVFFQKKRTVFVQTQALCSNGVVKTGNGILLDLISSLTPCIFIYHFFLKRKTFARGREGEANSNIFFKK